MRHGFTTGSCAAAAAKAAAYMLLSGQKKESIVIETPKGIPYHASVLDIAFDERAASCAVRKDGGDDPDVTTGSLVYAAVEFARADTETVSGPAGETGGISGGTGGRVRIFGGEGIGRVTKPGLDQPVGEAAINSVPRQMITKEVTEVLDLFDEKRPVSVTVSVPGGEEVAKKTFNPRLGIVGGISILGTSGVVEPMSIAALLATIRVELNQHFAEGERIVLVAPGNYGRDFMQRTYGIDLEECVKCSNFIGDMIDMAAEIGFEAVLLAGHSGKLVKVAGGIMNTHSREADSRMELVAAACLKEYMDPDTVRRILDCIATEEAFRIVEEAGYYEQVQKRLMEQIDFYLKKRAAGRLAIECIMYTGDIGTPGMTNGASDLLAKWKTQEARIGKSAGRPDLP